MNTLCVRLLPLVCVLILMIGCNNDIFIDEEPTISVDSLDIPDGGEATFEFPTRDLVSVEVVFDYKFDCVKYLPSGDEFARYTLVSQMSLYDITSSQPFITRLTASNEDAALEIYGSPEGKIGIRSIRNIRGDAVCGRIIVSYRYKEINVDFSIASSFDEKPVLEAKRLVYREQTAFKSVDNNAMMTVRNNTTVENVQKFTPADYCRMFVYIQQTTICPYEIDYGEITIGIPTWDPSTERPAFIGATALLRPGTEVRAPMDYVLPDGQSFTTQFAMTTPPMTESTLKFTSTAIIMTTYATLYAVNPRSGREHELEIRVDVVQPVQFSYSVETKAL